MKKILAAFCFTAALTTVSSCRPMLEKILIKEPVATEEKSTKKFLKTHDNTDDLYYYDQELFDMFYKENNFKLSGYATYAVFILDSNEQFYETASESCSVEELSKVNSIDELKPTTKPNFRKQLNLYPEARQRIQNHDGHTMVVTYSVAFPKFAARSRKEFADDYQKKFDNMQVIYLAVDLKGQYID